MFSDAEWRTYFSRQQRGRIGYTVVLQDRPSDIPGKLWGDF